MGQLTAGTIIQRARDQSPAFVVEKYPDRVALVHLSDRHATIYRALAHGLKDRFSEARKVADTISNALVGVDSDGVAFSVTTSGDGFDVIYSGDAQTDTGFFYTGPTAIAVDPYTDGFPLPSDSIEIIEIYAENTDTNLQWPVRWHPQGDARRFSGLHSLSAIVNGWRLFPIKNPTNLTTKWEDVNNVVVSYVAEPSDLDDLLDLMVIPHVYQHVLKWELAVFFARRQRQLEPEGPDMLSLFKAELDEARGLIPATLTLDHEQVKVHQTQRIR